MNSLVGYGSSDEEDEAPAQASTKTPQSTSSAFVNGSSHGVGLGEGHVAEAPKIAEDAVVGPSMPSDTSATATDAYEEEAEQELPSMSERDQLRYLTQPSHPMASLPPGPTSEADSTVTAKFKRFLELKAKGVHFNQDLAGKSSFKNPTLFASLLERSGLLAESQYASTLPSDMFSIDILPPWAYKEQLLKSQQTLTAELEATRKAQSAAGKRTIEFASAGDSRNQGSTPKRSHR
ncbi:hypothetical protein LTR70_008059 [Exophiala xenobiotica]|uniref:HCNGP-like protein-domain-containing protein n=1 Tax=Lithohypha guttulata TaxID=1690604 RepID=A0ABR0K2I1_9EURO|nr:hypothetical protein LTR24_007565 [Lithohypha guttulata]KAK5312689.1 hypothetical protein LTR70_008059 [Exophiala xenobiotica]